MATSIIVDVRSKTVFHISMSSIFDRPRWLGYNHDGYALTVDLENYLPLRGTRLDGSESPSDTLASHQSWLTLGLLEAVTLKSVHEADLLVNENVTGEEVQVLCPKKIALLLQHCDNLPDRLEGRALQSHVGTIGTYLHKALGILHSLIRNLRVGSSGWPESAPANLSFICLVCEAVNVALNGLCLRAGVNRSSGPGPHSWSFVLELFKSQVEIAGRRNGWCPFTLGFLMDEGTISGVDYALHQKSTAPENHDTCSFAGCNANKVDPDDYTAKHVDGCLDCVLVRPPCKGVKDTILKGQIPVLNMEKSCLNSPSSLNLWSADEKSYVAFPHVWADGLGSVAEKGLPQCHVNRLATLAAELVPGGYFWIDSLWVPEDRAPRKKAIQMMGMTYKKAAKVLVLDASIQKCLSEESQEQKLLYVLASGWMRRLWTLQEGILATELVFRFAGSSISMHELIPKMADLHQNPLLTSLASGIHRLSKKGDNQKFTLGDVSRAVRWRTTTRMADETLAIASLLDVDTKVLLDTAPAERIKELLLMVKYVPPNILFLTGEKSTTLGFRWAPKTLMSNFGGLNLSVSGNQAEVSTQGLIGTYYVYMLPTDGLSFEPDKWWQISDQGPGGGLHVVDPYNKEGPKYPCDILIMPERLSPGHTLAAVAARFIGVNKAEGTVYCGYSRRLISTKEEVSATRSEVVCPRWAGTARLCIC